MAALLTSATANGAGTGAEHNGDATVFVYGTFDGATICVQVSPDNTNWVKADNVSVANPSRMVAPGVVSVGCKGTYYIRCVVSGAGSSTSVSAVSTQ